MTIQVLHWLLIAISLLNVPLIFWFYWMFYDHFSARSLLAKPGRKRAFKKDCYYICEINDYVRYMQEW